MTTTEADIERAKAAKIKSAAAEGAAVAEAYGQDPGQAGEFLGHYFRHVDSDDIDTRSDRDLVGLVGSHYRLALERPSARANVAVFTPTLADYGWTVDGAVVQIVTDDEPFLVDSVTMEILRQGWNIREVFHPQFFVQRDASGWLHSVLHSDEAQADPNTIAESWMHLEITPATGTDPTTLGSGLESGLIEVLRSVNEAVTDWEKMRQMAADASQNLQPAPSARAGEENTAHELLDWLTRDNFTFLGYCEYDVASEPAAAGDEHAETTNRQISYRLTPVAGTGLGILRSDQAARDRFDAVPLDGSGPPRLMVITKDSAKSRVHRPTYLDYIGIRQFDADGQVTGERRFLGLFASTAYTDAVTHIPILSQKAAEVLRRSGYDSASHGAKAIMDVLNNYPRDELFQASASELAPVVERISRLKERRQVRVFTREDDYQRYLSCLVYFPRDRDTTQVRDAMEQVLLDTFGGESVDYTSRVTESVLARLHFVVRMPPGTSMGAVDVTALEQQLSQTTRSWDDDFVELVSDLPHSEHLIALSKRLPEGYREDFTPKQAMKDLEALTSLTADSDMAMAMYRPDGENDQADLRLKIFRQDAAMSLSRVLPHLSLLGVDVVDEYPYELALTPQWVAHVYEFGFRVPGGGEAVDKRWDLDARKLFMDAFRASYTGLSEADPYNRLVMGADLDWSHVNVLRAIGRYLRQGGATYSQTYIAAALTANTEISRLLVSLFTTKFDPDSELDSATRSQRVSEITDSVRSALDQVTSLDQDRIIRSYLTVLNATVRTNFYQSDHSTIALKLQPRKIPELPEPRPAHEIYVYAPRVEGVHLRYGAVARGGLRWSDRSEDFRTEVLGLVKAQMVKNAVIVPVGAKGGFYCKQLPDPSDRDTWMTEGIACYRLFVRSLLDLTDNIVESEVIPPERVVRYDGDDTYLVVAADKGTASFSDIANEVATDRGYWLGDAFASGGSAGYDHKEMGITARGAWESVRRHFRELGIDMANDEFSCVGIGDMSGDVFGNGMLLSNHLRLVAAFDHRHVFIDPNPDAASSWAERKRMFDLPRSSWADYDTSLISEGGGVFSRSLKAIKITPPMRAALAIDESVTKLSPAEMISVILQASVDLLWNGGVGTYVKASSETAADVGDKSNDQVRVNGKQLRARCVGEGGNLGFTQLGRIEYATNGGKINADFIDNSAGVDASDHEVNIKILLAGEVASGRLTMTDRNALLASMTDEVAGLVLENNVEQNLALANSGSQTQSMARVHEDWMARLTQQRVLDRKIEFLPTTEEMAERTAAGRGLTTPELATLLSWTKIVLERDVLDTDLPDDPNLTHLVIDYFPPELRQRYADQIVQHRLHREIIATAAVNAFVNRSGITCFHRLSGETGAGPAEVIRAQIVSRSLFGAAALEDAIAAADHHVDASVQTQMRMQVRTLVERSTRWVLNNRRPPIDIGAAVDQFGAGVTAVFDQLPQILTGPEAAAFERRRDDLIDVGVGADLAARIATLPAAYSALTAVQTANRDGRDPLHVAEVHFCLWTRLGLDRLLNRIVELPRTDRWQTMARAALRDDLHSVHGQLAAEALASQQPGQSAQQTVDSWADTVPGTNDAIQTLSTICDGEPDLARMSVGLRVVRSLLPAAG